MSSPQGFSLLEVMITTAIFGVLLVGVCTLYASSLKSFNRGQNKIEAQQNARVGIAVLAREVRLAGYDPSDAMSVLPTTAIETASANTVTFIADVDGDAVSDRVRYSLQGTRLVRDSAAWGGTNFPALAGNNELAEGVTALTFTYFDGNNITTATLANIRRVTIGITTQETTSDGNQLSFPLTLDVRLRNLP